jgi:uncharacterized protein with von Willebrand factor type A (vWA) domain
MTLRRRGVPVGMEEWLALHRALSLGMVTDLDALHALGRAILTGTEAHFDAFDVAFAEAFGGAVPAEIHAALSKWLEDPTRLEQFSPELFEQLTGLSLEELRKRFEDMLREQEERHDGGNRFIGTGGTSPYGTGGANPTGVRVGGGGGRSAVQVAQERRFKNYRRDIAIDVRQFKQGLRALRSLAREGEEVLDLDRTIDETCRNAGDIEIVFGPERRNTIKLLLLMDAGGSMTPFARLVERLFTAASETSHWKRFEHYFFHNILYDKVYSNIERHEGIQTAQLLRDHPADTKVIFVGDACMAPWELTMAGGAINYWERNATTGLEWLQRVERHFRNVIWLNPERPLYWDHPTIQLIGRVVPMFPLTLDGISRGIKSLRQARARS